MIISFFASYFGTSGKYALIFFLHYVSRFQRFGKTGPAGAGIEFIPRTEKRLPGNNIHIDTLSLVVPILIMKCHFSAVFLSYLILDFGKFILQSRIVRFIEFFQAGRFETCLISP